MSFFLLCLWFLFFFCSNQVPGRMYPVDVIYQPISATQREDEELFKYVHALIWLCFYFTSIFIGFFVFLICLSSSWWKLIWLWLLLFCSFFSFFKICLLFLIVFFIFKYLSLTFTSPSVSVRNLLPTYDKYHLYLTFSSFSVYAQYFLKLFFLIFTNVWLWQ